LLDYAIRYYKDFVKPTQRHRPPTDEEKHALADLAAELRLLPATASPEEIQDKVYAVGKRHSAFANLRSWFQALYQILLGQNDGPRMGSFIALYGIAETIQLINAAIAGKAGEATAGTSSEDADSARRQET
jgi:lysyl-tRNA synthetase class 1